MILEKAGYVVLDCGEGRDAIHMACMHPPEVMLVDVMLPDMNGTDVVQELKRHKDCRSIKIVFLTGLLSKKATSSDSKYLFEVDDQQYRALPKPVKKSLLLKILKEAVGELIAEKKAAAVKRLEEQELIKKPLLEAAPNLSDDDSDSEGIIADDSLETLYNISKNR